MGIVEVAIDYAAPFFLISSPVTSYADQIISIYRTRSSAGFSLDIPLIMLVSSFLKIFYWFGEYYSAALLVQAVVMILVQLALLKVALDNRPSPGARDGIEHAPFTGHQIGFSRPYDFWQWRSTKPYWLFLVYFNFGLLLIHLTPISDSDTYISLLGVVGLAVEATLPLPQIWANYQTGSCKGFRLSVVAAWIIGDTMKMSYFLFSSEDIPLVFKVCGVFQCACDFFLGFQFWMYSRTPGKVASSAQESQEDRWGAGEKDIRMTRMSMSS